jgi:DNA-binding Lrp family transcriptional regulator
MKNLTLQQKADQLVKEHILTRVNSIVEEIAKHNPDADAVWDVYYPSGLLEEMQEMYSEVSQPPEAQEFWAVSDYLADELLKRGEAVSKDFWGLNVWGRCTSGQAIAMDAVIQEITDASLELYK